MSVRRSVGLLDGQGRGLIALASVLLVALVTTSLPAQEGLEGRSQTRRDAQGPSRINDQKETKPVRPFPPLSAEQQQRLDQVLVNWERHSSRIQTLRTDFVLYRYDVVFGGRDEQGRVIPVDYKGILLYKAPDKGKYEVESIEEKRGPLGLDLFNRNRTEISRWICDGQAIYQYEDQAKEVFVTRIPPELQGEAISESPLPFVFGIKTEQAKERYWLRLLELPNVPPQEAWLEVWPRRRADAANFRRAVLIVDTQTYLPRAVMKEDPSPAKGENQMAEFSREVYVFYDDKGHSTIEVNDRISDREFHPTIPFGYRVTHAEDRQNAPSDRAPQTGSRSPGDGQDRQVR